MSSFACSDSPGIPDCRICRDPAPPLLQPCRCSSYIHMACLKRWVSSRSDSLLPLTFSPSPPSCEVCLAPYQSTQTHFSNNAPKPPSCTVPSLLSRMLLGAPDPLELQPRSAFCEYIISLECCVLLCLFVLALSGHTIFLLHVYGRNTAYDDYAKERRLLACANAFLTAGLLILIRRIVSRWLRDDVSFSTTLPIMQSVIASRAHSTTGNVNTDGALLPSTLRVLPTATDGEDIRNVDEAEDSVGVSGFGVRQHYESITRESLTQSNFIARMFLGCFLTIAAGAEIILLASAI